MLKVISLQVLALLLTSACYAQTDSWFPFLQPAPTHSRTLKPTPKPVTKPAVVRRPLAVTPTPTPKPEVIPDTAVGVLLRNNSITLSGSATVIDANRLRSLYRLNGYLPYFTDQNGLSAAGLALQSALSTEPLKHGLHPSDYWTADIDARISARDPQTLTELEVLLSQAFVQFASDLATGRTNPEDAGQNIGDFEMKKRSFKDFASLKALVAEPSASPEMVLQSLTLGFSALAPQGIAYQRMSQLLVQLSELKQAQGSGAWPTLHSNKKLKPGMSDAVIPLVRDRLIKLGVLQDSAGDSSRFYDQALEDAVITFQDGMKLSPDGVIGAGTIQALGISLDERIHQLRANLERWRLLPHDLGSEYVFVDLGKQEFKLYKDGVIQLEMKTVNGRTDRQTPSFIDQVNEVIINPYWNAPTDIVVKDMLPQALRDPLYFSEMRVQVFQNGHEIDPVSVDWSVYSLKSPPPFNFREEPGDNNSLGRVKFNLALNQHDIYMHDTNHHELFKENLRLFSSGCIRLERPFDFANYLLNQQGISADDIDAMVNDPSVIAKPIGLRNVLRVYIVVMSVAVDQNGTVRFGPEIYGQDQRFIDALEGKRVDPNASNAVTSLPTAAP